MMTPEKYKTLKLNKTSEFDAMLYETLEEIHATDLKHRISRAISFIIKEVHEELDQWIQNPKNTKQEQIGVVINGKWHRLNTIETNSSGLFYLFNQCNVFLNSMKKQGIPEIILSGQKISTNKIFISHKWDYKEAEEKIKKLLQIIRYKSTDWFVPGHTVCDELIKICYEVMLIGDTAELLCEMYLNKICGNYRSYRITDGLGDMEDIKTGTDLWVNYEDGKQNTYQIKNKFYNKTNDSIITSANFSETSKCRYFILVYKFNIVIIENNKLNKRRGKEWSFPLENTRKFNTIDMFEELKNLMRICGNNDIQMSIKKEGENNFIDYDESNKILIINFPNDEDENFKKLVNNKIEDLKQRFNQIPTERF